MKSRRLRSISIKRSRRSRHRKKTSSRRSSQRRKKAKSRRSSSSQPRKQRRSGRCKKYYVSRLKELNPSALRQSLERIVPCDWIEVKPQDYGRYQYKKGDESPSYVDFLFQDGEKSDRRLYHLLTKARGRLNAESITNKANLHYLLNYYGQHHMIADTDVFDHSSRPNFNKYRQGKWIWRPASGWEGRDVHVVSTPEELQDLWSTFQKSKKWENDSILVSKYIDNPLLIDGYKFHIRMHLILKLQHGKKVCGALVKTGKIIRAKLPYKKEDYRNPNIHDTHARYNAPLKFPDDFPPDYSADTIFSNMLHAVSVATRITTDPNITSLGFDPISVLPESSGKKTTGFEIFGCDFMVDETGKVFLIEINKKPGFSGGPSLIFDTSQKLFTTIAELLYGNGEHYTYASPILIDNK